MRRVIDGHNDVLTHLHENGADDEALLREGTAAITVPSARAGGLAAGLFAVLPPVGSWDVRREPGGYEVPRSARSSGRRPPARSARWRRGSSGC